MKSKKIDREKIKTWFVTGASSGVGKELCLQLLERNYNVIAISRSDIGFNHENLLYVKTDVTKPEEIENAIKKGLEKFSKIDVLVNCAGVSAYLTVEEETDFREVMEVNFWGSYNTIKALLPIFRENNFGTIVNCTSKHGLVPRAFGGAYCASKYALEGLTGALRLECESFLRVMTFELGFFQGTKIGANKPRAITKFEQYKNLGWTKIKPKKNYQNNLSKGMYFLIEEIEKLRPQNHLLLGGDCIEQVCFELKELCCDLKKSKKRAYQCTKKDIKTIDRTDYLIINFWHAFNYGAAVTAWAMQELIKSFKKSCLTLNRTYLDEGTRWDNSFSKRFALKFLNLSKMYNHEGLKKLSKNIKGIILGSDQVLRCDFIARRDIYKYLLNFANLKTRKIALSASFGVTKEQMFEDENFNPKTRKYYQNALNSFDYLSSRELEGKKIFKDIFNLESDFILDPVFLIDREKYDEIIKFSKIDNSSKIFGYILDEKEKYQSLFEYISKKENAPFEILNEKNYNVEDWLKSFKECKMVITDSFHGACFAIIFNKPFICIKNHARGVARFETLIETFDIKDNFISNYSQEEKENLKYRVDYNKVNKILEEKKTKDLKTVEKVLNEDYSNNPNALENKIRNEMYLKSIKIDPFKTFLIRLKYFKNSLFAGLLRGGGEKYSYYLRKKRLYKYLSENPNSIIKNITENSK